MSVKRKLHKLSQEKKMKRPEPQIKLALQAIDEEIRSFVEQIVGDTEGTTENIYYKTNIENMHYLLRLFDKESGQTVGHAWGITIFLELCASRKIEFELNKVVRKMLIELRDNQSKDTIWVS